MNFSDHMARIFGLRGVAATFTPDGGSAAACRAIRQGGGAPVRVGPLEVVVDRVKFHVLRAEVAAPAAGDVLTWNGADFTIEAVEAAPRDPDRLLWQLEAEWGVAAEWHSVSGSGATQAPPQGTGYKVDANASAGAAQITVSASPSFIVGRLLAGDTFTIAGDATVYTVSGPVTAASSKFTDVGFSPVLAADADAGDAVTFDFARAYAVRAAVAGYEAGEVQGGVLIGDRRLIVMQAGLTSAGMSDTPKAGDRVVLGAETFNVVTATPYYQGSAAFAWDIQVRG